MKQNMKESTIAGNYTQKVTSNGFYWDLNDTPKLVDILFTSISDFLSINKSKNRPFALKFVDLKGTFLMASIISYVEASEEGMPGNWEYEFILKEENIPQDAEVALATDPQYQYAFFKTGELLYGMQALGNTKFFPLCIDVVLTILEWLDTNASDNKDEEVELVADGLFIATAKVDPTTTEIIKTISPDGKIKEIVKGDSALEIPNA